MRVLVGVPVIIRSGATVAAIWLAACRAPVPEQTLSRPSPPRASPPVASPASVPALWLYRVTVERRAYAIDRHAILKIQQDTMLRTDSVSAHAELAFTAFDGGARVSGAVNVFRVQTPAREPAVPRGLTLPFVFSASIPARGGQLVFDAGERSTNCTSMVGGVVPLLHDLFFLAPDTLRAGTTWSDSGSYVTCRDSLPMRATVVRTFRLAGFGLQGGRLVLTIGRTSRTVLEGGGQQAGEPVEVAGSGTGDLSYTADPANGEVLSATGSSTLELTLQSRLRVQRVRQTSDVRITRRP